MHFFISAAIWYGEGWKSICQYGVRGCHNDTHMYERLVVCIGPNSKLF